MKTVLKKYKHFDVSLQELKNVLGDDLYNVTDVMPEKVSVADVVYAIKQYLSKAISLSELVQWVNVVWFTELYEYVSTEENSIASVMALLETLDEGVKFTDEEYTQMIECLEKNKECKIVMCIGKIIDNYTFYEGYEDEPEIILTLPNSEAVHIWEGYFDDIYDTPSLDGKGWKGFTRDYHQMEGIFINGGRTAEIDPKEYLDDLILYKDKNFDFEETTQVFELMVTLFEKAVENGVLVKAEKV